MLRVLQDHLAALRPGALNPATWMAAVRQHLAVSDDLSCDAASELNATLAALWNLLATVRQQKLPPLEVFVMRCAFSAILYALCSWQSVNTHDSTDIHAHNCNLSPSLHSKSSPWLIYLWSSTFKKFIHTCRLAHMRSFEEQLDHVAQQRPEGLPQGAWDADVSALLSRVAYQRHLAARYLPTALLHAPCLLMNTPHRVNTPMRLLSHYYPAKMQVIRFASLIIVFHACDCVLLWIPNIRCNANYLYPAITLCINGVSMTFCFCQHTELDI